MSLSASNPRSGDGDSEWQGDRLAVGPPAVRGVCDKYTDPGFWKVFDFRFISGKPFTEADFISGLPRVVITNTLARKLFGSEDPIGKEVLMAMCRMPLREWWKLRRGQPTVLMRMFGFPIPAIRIM